MHACQGDHGPRREANLWLEKDILVSVVGVRLSHQGTVVSPSQGFLQAMSVTGTSDFTGMTLGTKSRTIDCV